MLFFKLVEGDQSRKSIASIEQADAIVVLSGMLEINEVGDSTYPYSFLSEKYRHTILYKNRDSH